MYENKESQKQRMRCKACDAILSDTEQSFNPQMRTLENLCQKCLNIARDGRPEGVDLESRDALEIAADMLLEEYGW